MGCLSPGDSSLRFILAIVSIIASCVARSAVTGWMVRAHDLALAVRTRMRAYRQYALLYCLVVGVGGALLQRRGVKAHFFGTYLNIVANVLFWAVLSGVFQREGYGVWLLALLLACGASLAWGLTRRQFVFVAYSAVYGYVGVSAMLIRNVSDFTLVLTYFVFTAVAMVVGLVLIARRFGRQA